MSKSTRTIAAQIENMSSHRQHCTLSICLGISKICYHPIDHVCTPPQQQCCSINLPKFSIFFFFEPTLPICLLWLPGWREEEIQEDWPEKFAFWNETHIIPYYLLSITMLVICACAILPICCSIVPYFFPIKSQCSQLNSK